MNFPERIVVIARSADWLSVIPNVAIVLELQAPQKNNYFIGPVVTNANGQAVFTRKQCIDGIACTQKMFVMDYAGDLASCSSTAIFHLHAPEYIVEMIKNFHETLRFWGECFEDAERLFEKLAQVQNESYWPAQIVTTDLQMAQSDTIELLLRSNL